MSRWRPAGTGRDPRVQRLGRRRSGLRTPERHPLQSSNDLISVENQTNAFAFADPGTAACARRHNGHLGQKILVEGTAALNLAGHDWRSRSD
jgi:hypothetical protein